MDQAGVAVFGCGHWGSNIVRVMHRLGALRAVCDPDPAARRRAAGLAPGAALHATPEAALADPAVRAVMVATPAESHHRLAVAAVESGRDVFVEKPLTTRLEDALDLLKRADDAGRRVMVGHVLEYHPALEEVARLVRSGALGELRRLVCLRRNCGRVPGETLLWSLAPHDVAILLRLVGSMPRQVTARGAARAGDGDADAVLARLLFVGGVRAEVSLSWTHPHKERRLVVVGSRRSVSYCDVERRLLLHEPSGAAEAVPFDATEPLEVECRAFLDCVARARPPRADGRSGLAVLRVLAAAQRSLDADGSIVSLPRD